jgi:hypothetical protein
MKKTPSLFKRDYEGTRLVYDELVPGTEWVRDGEGIATIKIDGTSCLYRDGKLYRRYELKRGKQAPEGFEPAQEPDPVTGDIPGWVPVTDRPEDRWHREAFELCIERGIYLEHGQTYELIGPKVQRNPYMLDRHELVKHGSWLFSDAPPRDFEGLRAFLEANYCEGIVWHRGNGDMVKIKRRDFGIEWPKKA